MEQAVVKTRLEDVQRIEIGSINTPLQYMKRLTDRLNKGKLYIKRDDMTGLAFGGNKTRKLDYIMKYALDNGYTTVLTYGGVQTNHGRMTIAAAAKCGLKSVLICYGDKPDYASGNLILDRMLGAEIVFMDVSEARKIAPGPEQNKAYVDTRIRCTETVIKKYEDAGEKVLIVPVGGHNSVGTVGYIHAVKEIMDQMKEQNIEAKYLVAGYGSTGTYAGLWLGAKYYNAPFEVIGVPMSTVPNPLEETAKFINQVSEEFNMGINCEVSDLRLEEGPEDDKYAGVGYNVPDEKTRECMYILAREEGIITDPCYTGKTFRGYYEMIKNNVIPEGENAIFLHTGGTPAVWTKEHLDQMQSELWNEEGITII